MTNKQRQIESLRRKIGRENDHAQMITDLLRLRQHNLTPGYVAQLRVMRVKAHCRLGKLEEKLWEVSR